MIFREKLESLTETERDFLLYAYNRIYRPAQISQVLPDISLKHFTCFRAGFMEQFLGAAENWTNDEGKIVLQEIKNKLL